MFLTKEQMRKQRWHKFCEFMGMLAVCAVFAACLVFIIAMA